MNLTFSWLIACWLLGLPLSPSTRSLHPARSTSVGGNQPTDLQPERETIFVATNQQRARKRLALLRKDPKLMEAAQAYADLMAARDQMSHTIGGLTLTQKANQVGYAYRQISENIALNTQLAGAFVVDEQWMKSKQHRQNLLDPTSRDFGIGIAGPSKKNYYYYCQLFGTQR
jgi:uncharacterized protein YkwD